MPNAALHLEIVINTQNWSVDVKLNGQECPVSYAAIEDVALLNQQPVSFANLVQSLPKDCDLLKSLPQPEAYARQSEQFKADIAGLKDLLGVFSEQLNASHKLFVKQ